MINPIPNFIDKARGLTRNPLGIIALFISLIYGFACLVLGTSINNLYGCEERLPLIWFIIFFPLLILIAFIYLVVYHHTKLYAPSDFKDEKNFVNLFVGDKEVPSELEKVKAQIKSIMDEKKDDNLTKSLNKLSEYIESIKVKSESVPIPINNSWRLNHWGSHCASIVDNKMVFTGTSTPKETDGSHIDLNNILKVGKTYEISCFAKSDSGTDGKFQLWCHDQTSNGISVTTDYKTPSPEGEKFRLNFTAIYNPNLRIHLQYAPGKGRIEISDVKVSETKA